MLNTVFVFLGVIGLAAVYAVITVVLMKQLPAVLEIILFERPVRVGDLITVGDASGRVMRVRIRATTIRDFEQKEFLVPNKVLIPGRLFNWTLSDEMTRILIQVGITIAFPQRDLHIYPADMQAAMPDGKGPNDNAPAWGWIILRMTGRTHFDVLSLPETLSTTMARLWNPYRVITSGRDGFQNYQVKPLQE